MALKRLSTFASIHKRASLFQYFFAGSSVPPDLKLSLSAVRSRNFSSGTPCLVESSSKKWVINANRRGGEFEVATSTDDNEVFVNKNVQENELARNILVESKRCEKTLGWPLENIEEYLDKDYDDLLNCGWSGMSPDEAIKAFTQLSCYIKKNGVDLNENQHGKILSELATKLKDLDNKQLLRLFQCLLLWHDVHKFNLAYSEAFMNLMKSMDEILMERYKDYSIEELLQICDYLSQLVLQAFRNSDFVWKVMSKYHEKPNQLTLPNFVHFMYLANIYRKHGMLTYKSEYRLDQFIDQLTANECGLVCITFFKAPKPFRDNKVLVKMQQKIINEVDNVKEIALCSIMKMTRFSTNLNELETFRQVLRHIRTQVNRMSLLCLTHIIHSAGFVQCYDKELLDLIIKRFEADIDNARIKDIERLCYGLLIFNLGNYQSLINKIIVTLQDPAREKELSRYPNILTLILSYLSSLAVYPIPLIEKVLDHNYLLAAYHDNIYKTEFQYFILDTNMRVDVPEYTGPFLKDNVLRTITKRCTKRFNIDTSNSRSSIANILLVEVANICKSTLKMDKGVYIGRVLPHYLKDDVVVCLDDNNEALEVESVLSQMPDGTVRYAPKDIHQGRWIAIVFATQNQLIKSDENIEGSLEYCGPLWHKLCQLKKIGYTPVVISVKKWFKLETREKKTNYIKDLLLSSKQQRLQQQLP